MARACASAIELDIWGGREINVSADNPKTKQKAQFFFPRRQIGPGHFLGKIELFAWFWGYLQTHLSLDPPTYLVR